VDGCKDNEKSSLETNSNKKLFSMIDTNHILQMKNALNIFVNVACAPFAMKMDVNVL
jgi:hypothetical protein